MSAAELIIDVRESDEFRAERVPGSLHLPLSQLEMIAPGILKPLSHCSLTILCRGGTRALIAFEKLQAMNLIDPASARVFEGGILEWKRQGRPVEGGAGGILPLMRQVQLVAGLLVLTGALLALFVDPRWIYLTLFVGTGLTVAGSTGFCGMALLLQKMPWNHEKRAAAPSCAGKN